MKALETFLDIVKDEFGEKINFSHIETEGFAGVICLNDHSAEVTIRINDCYIYDNDLSAEENNMLDAFIDYTQDEMRKQKIFIKNGRVH